MKLVEQWRTIEAELPENWAAASLAVRVETAADAQRAAGLLGPANPGRVDGELRFTIQRGGGGVSAEGVRRLFDRLDRERIWAELRLVESVERPETAPAPDAAGGAVASWDAALAALPPDWSDLHCEVELSSSDDLDRAALLLAPVNPARDITRLVFRFRVARLAGYGGSAAMARRCFERLDGEHVRATARVLRALSDTHHVATQGPVWRIAGQSV